MLDDASATEASRPGRSWAGPFARAIHAEPGELKAVLLAFAYFFFLLSSYYILRPLRDEMGVAGGVEKLPWLFSGTFAAMLVAVPAFSALAARMPRHRFIPVAYRFFIGNILLFWALFATGTFRVGAARAFFIWTSVYNLFVVSVFWSFMADIFRHEQGARLFGFIAAGGSAGALAGPLLTTWLVKPLGTTHLLLVSAVLLEISVQCVLALHRWALSAHAARLGLQCYVFIPNDLEPGKILGSGIYCPQVVAIKGNYDDVNRLCTQIAEKYGWGFANINLRSYYAEGAKTYGFEIAEQLGWKFPRHVVSPVAGGTLLPRIARGFREMKEVGLVSGELPAIHAAQAAGCAPVINALAEGLDFPDPVKPNTIARSIAIGNPADGFQVLQAVRSSGGSGAMPSS